MKRILIALPLLASLGGCATYERVVGELSSPATTQAAQNVATIANAVECFVSAGSSAVATGLPAGSSQNTVRIIYTISSGLCATKYGTPGAPVAVPAAAVVVQ